MTECSECEAEDGVTQEQGVGGKAGDLANCDMLGSMDRWSLSSPSMDGWPGPMGRDIALVQQVQWPLARLPLGLGDFEDQSKRATHIVGQLQKSTNTHSIPMRNFLRLKLKQIFIHLNFKTKYVCLDFVI